MTVSDTSSLWANLVGLSHSIRPGFLCAIDKTQPTMPQETRSGHPCSPKLKTLLSIWAETMHPIRLCKVPTLQVSWYSCFFQAQNLVAKAVCCLVRILLFLLWTGASPLYLDLGFGILPLGQTSWMETWLSHEDLSPRFPTTPTWLLVAGTFNDPTTTSGGCISDYFVGNSEGKTFGKWMRLWYLYWWNYSI